MHAGLALVSEINIALRIASQVVDALEALGVTSSQIGLNLSRLNGQAHQSVLVVSNQKFLVRQKLHAVRLAVIFDDLCPIAFRVDTKDSPKNNIGHIQVALRIKDRALQERVHRSAATVGIRPGRTDTRASELARHLGEYFGWHTFWSLSEKHIFSLNLSRTTF